MDTNAIMKALRTRYAPPAWAAFEELGDLPGLPNRRIDLLAVSCWQSKGWLRVAVEVKTNRADFLRELEQPDKRKLAESIAHECWFAAPAGVCAVDELPVGWGLLVIESGKTVRVKRAKAAQQRKPGPLPEAVMVAIMRRLARREEQATVPEWLLGDRTLTLDQVQAEARRLTAEREQELDKVDVQLRARRYAQDDREARWSGPLRALLGQAGLPVMDEVVSMDRLNELIDRAAAHKVNALLLAVDHRAQLLRNTLQDLQRLVGHAEADTSAV